MYIKDLFSYKIIFSCHFLECLTVNIYFGASMLCVCLLYRPPSSSAIELDNLYSTLCTLEICLFSHFILIGDFNVDFSPSSNHHLFSKLHNIASSFVLTQVVTQPTHFSHDGTPSLIDLAFVSSPSSVTSCETVAPLSNSDHLGILLTYKFPHVKKSPNTPVRKVWHYSSGDFERACEMLDSINWDSILDKENINLCWREWQNIFLYIMSVCIPKKMLPSRKNLPWISNSILKAIRTRKRLFKAFKRTGCIHKLSQYRIARNRITNEIRKAKMRFFEHTDTSNSKTYWKLFKLLTKKQSSVPILQDPNSGRVTSDIDKANMLNTVFASNFNHIDIEHLNQTDYTLPPATEFHEEFLCTEEQVFTLISSLNISKSTGADGISARMLKQTIHSITPSVTKLFNLSLKSGIFPDDWKFAKIVPIPKSGDLTNPSNYRPISILPLLSKLLERHVYNLLSAHFLDTSPLSSCLVSVVSLRGSLQYLPCFHSPMTATKLWIMVVKYALYFLI